MTQLSQASVLELHRYPVKSMMGESITAVEITDNGFKGDRILALRDEVRGGIRGAKKIPQLMTFSARTEETVRPSARITAPSGETLLSTATEINDWLSAELGHPVSLWPLLPAAQLEHYRRGAPDSDDMEQELRALFGRLPQEPLPDLSLFAEVLEFESPPGTYFDAFPLNLLSRQSLMSIAATNATQQFDSRRFRPNILIDLPDIAHPYPETTLTGQQLRIGDSIIEFVGACPRCSMTTHGFADLPKDTGIMRTLVEQTEGNLGCYAKVIQPGTIRCNDAISLA